MLPANSSLSITLDRFYTITSVEFREDLPVDEFYLDGEKATPRDTEKVSRFLDRIRDLASMNYCARVKSENHVPVASGFASSASGFAALTLAATKAAGLCLSRKELSILARYGSGSACRSIYGGFVEWRKGSEPDGSDSYAISLYPENYWNLSILSCLVDEKRKRISSREGMKRTAETSPFFPAWTETAERELERMKEAIAKKDFIRLGEVAERNACMMHATNLGAVPPFIYWSPETLAVIDEIRRMREEMNIPVYFTIDAGPNVKVLTLPEWEAAVAKRLQGLPAVKGISLSHPGPEATWLLPEGKEEEHD